MATQDPGLRKKFTGKPEYAERFLRFIAREMREYMSQLGFRTVDEMIGRVDMLEVAPAIDHWKAKNLDLTPILMPGRNGKKVHLRCTKGQESNHRDSLDYDIIDRAHPALKNKEQVKWAMRRWGCMRA